MTSTSERRLVFLDATVLAAPTTRSLILFGQLHFEAHHLSCWTLAAEDEADRALTRRSRERRGVIGRTVPPVLVSDLRRTADLGGDVIVPPAPKEEALLADTHAGDRHILAAAWAAGSRLVLTVNVTDFGRLDLERLGMSVVNPDLFLAYLMTPAMYRFALEEIASRRTLAPNTPETMHASLAKAHPCLVGAMRDVYPGIDPVAEAAPPPTELFRGDRCVVCARAMSDPKSLELGIGPECAAKARK